MKKKYNRDLYSSNITVLDSLIPAMIMWAEEREDFNKMLQAIGAMAFDLGAPRFDPEWYAESRTKYIVSRILTDNELLKEFQSEHEITLRPDQQDLLQLFNQHPAYWIFSELPRDYTSHFIIFEVQTEGEKTVLVRHLLQDIDEVSLFPYRLDLVFDNGDFVQTTALQHRYVSVDSKSIHFFLTGLQKGESVNINSASMTQCITNHYDKILLLDSIAFENDTVLGKDAIEILWETFPLPPNFLPRTILGRWRYSRRNNFFCMVYDKPDKLLLQQKIPPNLRKVGKTSGETWEFPEYFVLALFIDSEKQQLAAYANTRKAWQLLSYLLAPAIPAVEPKSADSQFRVSLPTLSVTAQLKNFHYPWLAWEPLFTPLAKEVLEEPLDISKSRAVLHEFLDNEDPRFNLAARCLRMGVNPILITEIAQAIEAIDTMEESERSSFSLTSIAGDFELHDFVPLSKEDLPDLTLPLEESVLFYLDVRNAYPLFASYTHGAFVDTVQASDLIESIDDLFYDLYVTDEIPHPIVMNYLFLLFLHTGRKWTPVRTYVIELLKLLYAFIDFGDEETKGDLLAAQLSQFIYNQLCHYAIAEIKEEPTTAQLDWGTYLIRPTKFFFTLINRRFIE